MSVFKTTKEIETSKAHNTITGSGDVYRAGERSGAYANIDSEIVTTMKEVPTTWGKVAPFVTPALTAALAATGVGLPLAGVIGAGGGAVTGTLSANNGIAENDSKKRRIKQVIPIKGAQHEQGGVDLKVGGVGVEAEGGEYKILFDDDTEAVFNQGQMNMLQQGVDPNEIIDTMPKIDEANTAKDGIVNKIIDNFSYKERDTFKDSIPWLNEIINDTGKQNHQTQLANLGIGALGLVENEALNNRIQKKDFYTPITEVNYAPTRMQRIDTMPEMRSIVDRQVNTGVRGLTEAGKSDRIGTFVEAANQSLQSMQGQQNQIDAQLANQEASLNAQGQQRTDSINAQIRAQNAQMEFSENQLKAQADSNTAKARQANLSGMIDTSEGDELMLALKKYGLIFGDQGDNTQPKKEVSIPENESGNNESNTPDNVFPTTSIMNALRDDIKNNPIGTNSNTTSFLTKEESLLPNMKNNGTIDPFLDKFNSERDKRYAEWYKKHRAQRNINFFNEQNEIPAPIPENVSVFHGNVDN